MKQWLSPGSYHSISILYFISGISIAFLAFFRVEKTIVEESRLWFYLSMIGLAACCIYGIIHADLALKSIEVNYRFADMLPIIQIMNERLLSGEAIYTIIPEVHGGMYPIYLPAMWLPFMPSVAFDFDPRWITTFFIIATLPLIFFSKKDAKRNLFTLAWLYLAFILIKTTFISDNRIVTMTEEGIVVGYYVFLSFALWKRNIWLISIGISLCLLSRYALVFWIPVYLVYLYLENEKIKAYKTALYSGLIGVFLMIISKSITKIPFFLSLQTNYRDAIANPDKEAAYYPIIHESLGIAKFFDYSQLPSLHDALLIFSLLTPVLFLLIYRRFRKYFNPTFFPLVSLKLSLVIFFNLLTMPYIYLFFTSSFVSIAIFYYYINAKSS
jgi:hypothetical protein